VQTLWAAPWLVRHGWHANRLMAWGMPIAFILLVATDGLGALGLARPLAFQGAMGVFLTCYVASYLFFLRAAGHNRAT